MIELSSVRCRTPCPARKQLALTIADHGLHLAWGNLLERLVNQPLQQRDVAVDDVVEPLPFKVVLDNGEATLDRVVLGRVRHIDDAGYA